MSQVAQTLPPLTSPGVTASAAHAQAAVTGTAPGPKRPTFWTGVLDRDELDIQALQAACPTQGGPVVLAAAMMGSTGEQESRVLL